MKLKIGFLALTMTEFDAVLKVEDVRKGDIPDIGTPEYLKPMLRFLEQYGEVIYPGVVGEEKKALEAHDTFLKEQVDVIVAHEISFALDLTCLQALDGINAPVVIWNTQMLRTLSPDVNFGQVMANSGVAGVPQLTNALYKQGRKFKVVTGHEGQEKTVRYFEKIFRAVGAAKKLKVSKVGKIGYVYPGMTTLTVEEASLKRQLGPVVENIPLRDIAVAAERVSGPEMAAELKKIKEEYKITGLSDQELMKAVKMYFAIKETLKSRDIQAAGVLCQAMLLDRELGTAPCLAMSRLMEEGFLFTCECDIPTAVAMIIMRELAGDAWFLEFYTMDMDRELLMLSHCGYGNCSMADCRSDIKIRPQPCFPGEKENGAAFEFGARGGPVTILSLTQSPNGRYKLVAARAEAVDIEPYPIACPQMMLRFKNKSLQDGIEDFCRPGAMHHMAVGYGDVSGEAELLAGLLDIEFELI